MSKKITSDRMNGTKNALFFLFPVSISFHFYESLYFCSTKCMDSLTLKHHNSFQNQNNGKATTPSFVPTPLIFYVATRSFKIH